jgi:hypothetical protein
MIARVHPAGVVAHHPSVRSTRGGVGRRESCANFSPQLLSLHLEVPESVAQSGATSGREASAGSMRRTHTAAVAGAVLPRVSVRTGQRWRSDRLIGVDQYPACAHAAPAAHTSHPGPAGRPVHPEEPSAVACGRARDGA